MASAGATISTPTIYLSKENDSAPVLSAENFKTVQSLYKNNRCLFVDVEFFSHVEGGKQSFKCRKAIELSNFRLFFSFDSGASINQQVKLVDCFELQEGHSRATVTNFKFPTTPQQKLTPSQKHQLILYEFQTLLNSFNEKLHNTMAFFMAFENNQLSPYSADHLVNNFDYIIKDLPTDIIEFQDAQGATPLIRACFHGHPKIIAKLLDLGSCLTDCVNGITALGFCCKSPKIDCLAELLKRQNDLDHCNQEGMHISTFAAKYSPSAEHLKLLIKAGADVNGGMKTDQKGLTPLMQSILATVPETRLPKVMLLLSKNVNIDTQDANGDTALHYAIKHGLFDCAHELVQANADTTLTNNAQQTAFRCYVPRVRLEGTSKKTPTKSECLIEACNKGHWFLVICMHQAGWKLDKPRRYIDINQKLEAIKRALEGSEGGDPKKSAIFFVIHSGDKRAAEHLYEKNKLIIGKIFSNKTLVDDIPEQYRDTVLSPDMKDAAITKYREHVAKLDDFIMVSVDGKKLIIQD